MLYIFRKGEQLGPYSEENIQTFLKIGSVEYTDFVWQEGWNDWKPLAEVFPPSPTPPPLPTPEPKPYQSVRMVGTKDHHQPPTIRASSGKKTNWWNEWFLFPETTKRKKLLPWLISKAVLLVFLLYLASPYYATYQIFEALTSGDTKMLTKRIDFPSLRESIKEQMSAHIMRSAKQELTNIDEEEDGLGILGAGLAAAVGPALVEGLVDSFVTPAGLAALISDPDATSKGANKSQSTDIRIPNIQWAFFTGPTEFAITYNDDVTLYLRIEDFGWRIYAIDLPVGQL